MSIAFSLKRICVCRAVSTTDGGAPPNHGQSPLNLLLLDEMQLTYSRPAQIDRLVEYMKDTAGIGHGVTRIIMASVHGDSPSLGTSSQTSSSSTTTPFNYGPEHLVQLLQNHSAVPLSDEALLELAVATSQAANRGDIAAKQQLSDKLGQQAPSVGFTAVETSDLWARHWDGQPAGSWFAMSDPSVQEHLWRVTAGQVSMVQTAVSPGGLLHTFWSCCICAITITRTTYNCQGMCQLLSN